MTTTTSKPSQSVAQAASHLATRGNRSLDAVRDLLERLSGAMEHVDAIREAIDVIESNADDYEQFDPADATGTDEREDYRERRTDAWYEIQAAAEEVATGIDSFIEALGMEAMR